MAPLSLKVILDGGAVTRTIKLDSGTRVADAHRTVREKMLTVDTEKEYGFFLTSADDKYSGLWLEADRRLEYYILKDGDSLHFLPKLRNLRVRSLDGTVKTLKVDESKRVGELMALICLKIGVANHEEYGLCREEQEVGEETKTTTGTLTIRRAAQREKDVQLQQLSKKLKTDDNVEWLDQHKTLRELRVDAETTLLFKRRLFYSDRNVDSRDPVQLNLLYVQTRDAILDGRQVMTEDKSTEFAGIQCQIQYGNFQEDKHKSGFIENLKEFLPTQYIGLWGIEKKIIKEHRKHDGLSQVEAKHLYIKTARELPTYGVTFFLVKEKTKNKKKLVPRLLGINSESILRLDEDTKEILQTWRLTQVKTFRAAKETFILNFGDYSEKEYAVKTNEAYRIKDILQGYIDIIGKKLAAARFVKGTEGEPMYEETLLPGRCTEIRTYTTAPSAHPAEHILHHNQIVSVEQGQNVNQNTSIVSVEEVMLVDDGHVDKSAIKIIQKSLGHNQFGKKLNFLNSASVRAVMLLTDPTEENIVALRDITQDIEENLPNIITGTKETAGKLNEQEQRKLLDELDELCGYINSLVTASRDPDFGDADKLTKSQDAARQIADLTTQMYFSLDPKTKRRSKLLLLSRDSFIADEKTEASLRRASLVASGDVAAAAADKAIACMDEVLNGQMVDKEEALRVKRDTVSRLGKLNAAVAQLLIAHADSKNVDYEMALNSMKTIQDQLPLLAHDSNKLSAAADADGAVLRDSIKHLIGRIRNICTLSGAADRVKMQDAGNEFADISSKLMFTLRKPSRVGYGEQPAEKDNDEEIKESTKEVVNRTSRLLVKVNELVRLAAGELRCADADAAADACADAAQQLLACARLTAPSIQEPHCQSALAAASENLVSSAQKLANTWKGLVEKPGNHILGVHLNERHLDLIKSLDHLKRVYTDVNGMNGDLPENSDVNGDKKQRLTFITSLDSAKSALSDASQELDNLIEQQANAAVVEVDLHNTRRELARYLSQLNAAIASLVQAAADRQNPDNELAEVAIDNISILTRHIVRSFKTLNVSPDWGTVKRDLKSVLDVTKTICEDVELSNVKDLNKNATEFAKSSGKLMFVLRPHNDVANPTTTSVSDQVLALSQSAYETSSDIMSKMNELTGRVGGRDGRALDAAGAQLVDAAQSLLTTAEIIAPCNMRDATCQHAITSAVDKVALMAKRLESTCAPIVEGADFVDVRRALHEGVRRLLSTLDALRAQCDDGSDDIQDPCDIKTEPVTNDRDQNIRLQNALASAKSAIGDAKKVLEDTNIQAFGSGPKINVSETRRVLANKLARLNAALASLVLATSARNNGDAARAGSAVDTVRELTSHIVNAAKSLNGNIDENSWSSVKENLGNVLEATENICQNYKENNGKDVNEIASKFMKSSGKLMYVFNPRTDTQKGNEVLGLSRAAGEQASVMLAKVYELEDGVNGDAGEALDAAGARVVDATQALLTCAQFAASSISDHKCGAALMSAVDKVALLTNDLERIWKPIVEHPEHCRFKDGMQTDSRTLLATLDTLRDLCQPNDADNLRKQSDEQDPDTGVAEQRVKFNETLSSAKSEIDNMKEDLEITKTQAFGSGPKINVSETRRVLANKLARLNAALASLVLATSDRQNPNIKMAEAAIGAVRAVTSDIFNKAKLLNGNIDENIWCMVKGDLKKVLEATKYICESSDDVSVKDVNETASKFMKSTGQLMYVFNPRTNTQKGNEVLGLSRAAGEQASVMLAKVYELEDGVNGDAGEALDAAGARVVDATQALLTCAQFAASSISDHKCGAALMSAVDKVALLTNHLERIWKPIVEHPEHCRFKDGMQTDSRTLLATLDTLRDLCQHDADNLRKQSDEQDPDTGVAEQRVKFNETLSSAKSEIDNMKEDLEIIKTQAFGSGPKINVSETRRVLANKLARLNAALASLVLATSDRQNPNIKMAEAAIGAVRAVTSDIFNKAKLLNGNIDENIWCMVKGDLKKVLEATKYICESSDDVSVKDVNETASKFMKSTGQLMYVFNPRTNIQKGNEVLGLSRSAGEQASVMLAKVYELEDGVNGDAGEALDAAGARVVDATQALLTCAQVAASSISNHKCGAALMSAVDNVALLTNDLERIWKPIVEHPEHCRFKDGMQTDLRTLQATLDTLRDLCQYDAGAGTPQIRQNDKDDFCSDHILSEVKDNFRKCESLLDDAIRKRSAFNSNGTCKELPVDVHSVTTRRRQLSQKLVKLNNAIAQLVQAIPDRVRRAGAVIAELTPKIVQDIIALEQDMEGESNGVLQEAKNLCKASLDLCSSVKENNINHMNEAASQYSETFKRLRAVTSVGDDPSRFTSAYETAKSVCERVTLLLSRVSHLVESVDPEHSQPLDASGATVADAAHSLLFNAQITGPYINDDGCRDTFLTSADKLSALSQDMRNIWKPLVENEKLHQLGDQMHRDHYLLQIGLNKLKAICEAASDENDPSKNEYDAPIKKDNQAEELVIEDTPLKQMALKILSAVQAKSESISVLPEKRNEFANFAKKLECALKTLELANAKCRSKPLDASRRQELEAAVLDLQQMCLFSKSVGAEGNYVIDLGNYINEVTSAAEAVLKATRDTKQKNNYVKDVQTEAHKIIEHAISLLNDCDEGAVEILDDIMRYDHFAKSCDDRVTLMKRALHNAPEDKYKMILQDEVNLLEENTDLMRFATQCNLASVESVSFDETLINLSAIENHIDNIIKYDNDTQKKLNYVKSMVRCAQEAFVSSLAHSNHIPSSFAQYVLQMRGAAASDILSRRLKDHLKRIADLLKTRVADRARKVATWQHPDGSLFSATYDEVKQELADLKNECDERGNEITELDNVEQLLKQSKPKIGGDHRELIDKFTKQINKLNTSVHSLILSSDKPEAAAKCVGPVAEAAALVAAAAAAVKVESPVTMKNIEEASSEMCAATYDLLRCPPLAGRMDNARGAHVHERCKRLRDSINKLIRTVLPTGKLQQECAEMTHRLQMQEAFLQARIPSCTLSYSDCLDALLSQQDVIGKLRDEESMSTLHCTGVLKYVGAATCNTAEYATQIAYLLSLSDKHRHVMENGLPDVPRLVTLAAGVRQRCAQLLYCDGNEQTNDLKSEIKKQTDQLETLVENAANKINGVVKRDLAARLEVLKLAATALQRGVAADAPAERNNISPVIDVIDAVEKVNETIEEIEEPAPGHGAQSREASMDIIDSSRKLIEAMCSMTRRVAADAADGDTVTWVMYGGADVVAAFQHLVNRIRLKGVEMKLIAPTNVSQEGDAPARSHLQVQIASANTWLSHPITKANIKEDGIRGVQHIIKMADEISADLQGADEDEMTQVVAETKHLLSECTQKYNSEKASLLMERLNELKKMLERGVVTRLVEEFLEDGGAFDLDDIVKRERDNDKRKFILEKKIGELLAHLGKVAKTARLVADAGSARSRGQLISTSARMELLAPALVLAAQRRVASPDDEDAIEKYKALFDEYVRSLGQMRSLCDRAVDPMDLVQAAGETMHCLKEQSGRVDDPRQCAHASAVILRLGNRVIEASMDSPHVKEDQEMHNMLISIKKTIASYQSVSPCPDWEAVTTEIIRKTSEVESVLGGEKIFEKEPEPNQPIYAAALDLHTAVRDWSARDNEIVAVAKRMAVLMAKLSTYVNMDYKREVIATSKSIVTASVEVAALAKRLALECTDMRIRSNLLQVCDRIPTIGGQLKMLTTVKGSSLGRQGTDEDMEAMGTLVCNAQNLMTSIQEVIKASASASVKIMSQRGYRMKWVRRARC